MLLHEFVVLFVNNYSFEKQARGHIIEALEIMS